ncbi:MAG: helix-hairpin-helix domain-containing protein [Gammaproteobacteria bacterium]|nr:helix-hairpin-helix domain-containing protein [Gammaproteobacteria bacterium]MCW8959253.1 helix-hairpin-helix domain-containing protein [Gammaproteobacteria bacterium]MCW8973595.1 helix-hairpin-helix domain-containing protein [Gammaproteobacteria bacterium]MCW8993271.1 helix-hairpin-helix domain-containing protein [Gammaproteobacteria bacterium]MCW9088915.1 helix-hairpin-helix domain-containing protein [Gammaproteobacteria bacterium]
MKRITRFAAILFFSFFSVLALAGNVDINSADASALAGAINGVGEKRALAIVEYREAHGPFKSVDELTKVKGIGPVLLEKSRDKLVATQAEQ